MRSQGARSSGSPRSSRVGARRRGRVERRSRTRAAKIVFAPPNTTLCSGFRASWVNSRGAASPARAAARGRAGSAHAPPSTSAPASRKSPSASGVSRNSIPTRSRIVSAFSSRNARPSSERTSTGGSTRVRNGTLSTTACGRAACLAGSATCATAHAVPLFAASAGPLGLRSSSRGEAHRLREPRVRVDVVRDRHRVQRSAPGTSGSTAVSIFSTVRTTCSISERGTPIEERDPRAGHGGVPRLP